MNKIEPNYVTFEQAKKLKEKGLKIREILDHDQSVLLYLKDGSTQRLHKIDIEHRSDVVCAVPEQWQVIEWASLVHNIDIEARPIRYAGYIKTSIRI